MGLSIDCSTKIRTFCETRARQMQKFAEREWFLYLMSRKGKVIVSACAPPAASNICKYFSHIGSLWRALFHSVALWSTESKKRAYFEWQLIINRLQRRILKHKAMKISTLRSVRAISALFQGNFDVKGRRKQRGGLVDAPR